MCCKTNQSQSINLNLYSNIIIKKQNIQFTSKYIQYKQAWYWYWGDGKRPSRPEMATPYINLSYIQINLTSTKQKQKQKQNKIKTKKDTHTPTPHTKHHTHTKQTYIQTNTTIHCDGYKTMSKCLKREKGRRKSVYDIVVISFGGF